MSIPIFSTFLNQLDWTDPCIDLIDAVTEWLMSNRPAMSYEECCDRADAIVMARLV